MGATRLVSFFLFFFFRGRGWRAKRRGRGPGFARAVVLEVEEAARVDRNDQLVALEDVQPERFGQQHHLAGRPERGRHRLAGLLQQLQPVRFNRKDVAFNLMELGSGYLQLDDIPNQPSKP